MGALNRFLEECRTVGGDAPEVERLADVLRVLQTDDSPHAIVDHDRLNKAAAAQRPLLERIRAMMQILGGRQS
jgi:hypothetical protein